MDNCVYMRKTILALIFAFALALIFSCGQHSFEEWLNEGSSSSEEDAWQSGSSGSSSSHGISSPSVSSFGSSSSISSSRVSSSSKFDYESEEMKLYEIMMAYRAEKGLPEIPISKSLTHVARTHVKDIYENYYSLDASCNAHSWSDKGSWAGCCYTPNHASTGCMWNKPYELTPYKSYGYEIATGHTTPGYAMTAEVALKNWQSSISPSGGHNAVIINEDKWKDIQWKAIGIGIYEGWAATWFGEEFDECEDECIKGKVEYKWCLAENYYGSPITMCKEINEGFTLSHCVSIGGFRPVENKPGNCMSF